MIGVGNNAVVCVIVAFLLHVKHSLTKSLSSLNGSGSGAMPSKRDSSFEMVYDLHCLC